MDWWLAWQILKGILAFGAILLAGASIIVIWRQRGILSWKRSLRNELKGLNNEAEATGEIQQQALTVVLERCQRAWRATSPELKELTDLSAYIHSIATCYHPGMEKPELRITTGRFLKSAQESVHRLELILRRPGFRRLRRVRIRHIRQSYEWYDRVNQYRIDSVIYNELCMGIVKQSSRDKFKEIIKNLVSIGADGMILGCTEIPLLINQKDVEIPLFDTTTIHSKAAVAFALNE
ncbi:unnamed protein product [marine sediment metagenome]|uniref:Aspartate racemase n=1 Tax=marine sediment metagenome TaxID=412755 RepID=X1S2Z5_9ZZZZ